MRSKMFVRPIPLQARITQRPIDLHLLSAVVASSVLY